MNIRNAHSDDTQEIVQAYFDMVHALNMRFYSPQQMQEWIPAEAALYTEKWEPVVASPHGYVAEIEGELSGFGAFDPESGSLRVFARTDYENEGVQEALLKLLMHEARKEGLNQLRMLITQGEVAFFQENDYELVQTGNDLFTHMVIIHL